MPEYRVKPGYSHGTGKRYGAGDIVELTEVEAQGFLDKLELVIEEKPKPAVAKSKAKSKPAAKKKASK